METLGESPSVPSHLRGHPRHPALHRGDAARQVRPRKSLLENGLPTAQPLLLADRRHLRLPADPNQGRTGQAVPDHLFTDPAAGVRVHPHARHLPARQRGSAHPPAGPAAVHHLAERREHPMPVEGQSGGPPLHVGIRGRDDRSGHPVPGRLLDDRRAPAHLLDLPAGPPSHHHHALLPDEALL